MFPEGGSSPDPEYDMWADKLGFPGNKGLKELDGSSILDHDNRWVIATTGVRTANMLRDLFPAEFSRLWDTEQLEQEQGLPPTSLWEKAQLVVGREAVKVAATKMAEAWEQREKSPRDPILDNAMNAAVAGRIQMVEAILEGQPPSDAIRLIKIEAILKRLVDFDKGDRSLSPKDAHDLRGAAAVHMARLVHTELAQNIDSIGAKVSGKI